MQQCRNKYLREEKDSDKGESNREGKEKTKKRNKD